MIEVRNRSVMNERGAQASDATIAGGPLTERGTVTELRPSTLRVVRDGQNGADGLGRLVADWEEGRTPSDLSDYLPDPAKIRRAALIELVGIDMEYRWLKNDCPKRLTDYCAEYPELLEEPLPAELLYEEFRLRKQGGEGVAAAEYLSEFPLQAESFEQMFDRDSMAGREDVMMLGLSGFDEFEIGQHLDDFELVLELGHGAFARVFLARQLSMQRWVALKISRNIGVEPQTLAQLDHPNIVRVFDQRLLEERALRVLFMEYVPGGTLLDVVKLVRVTPQAQRSGQLLLDAIDKTLAKKGEMKPSETSLRSEIAAMSWPETVAWMGMRLADALEYAREHGVLHRDIKPANVLLSVEGIPKLADFNVSSSEEVSTEDAACFVGGSLAYMSPEQLEACAVGAPGTLDTRSDIYALGVMLWELLTGSRPFTDDGSGENPPSPKKALEARRAGWIPQPRHGYRTTVRRAAPSSGQVSLAGERRKVVWRPKVGSSVRTVSGPVCSQSCGPTGREPTFDVVEVALPIVLAAIGIPNLLAAGYNYYYNKMLIISGLSPQAQQHLEQVHLVIGVAAFSLGAAAILYWCRLALTVPHGLRNGQTYSAEVLNKARTATLNVGHRAVVIAFGLWVLAGIAYPVALQIAAGGIPQRAYVHLMSSLAVCGAVAVAYPFFILTYYSVRCLYPILLSHGELRSDDGRDIRSLGRSSTRYLAVAASVPLVGIAGLSFVGSGAGEELNATVRALCLGGIAGFIVVYQLFRRIESDLRALLRVVSLEVSASP